MSRMVCVWGGSRRSRPIPHPVGYHQAELLERGVRVRDDGLDVGPASSPPTAACAAASAAATARRPPRRQGAPGGRGRRVAVLHEARTARYQLRSVTFGEKGRQIMETYPRRAEKLPGYSENSPVNRVPFFKSPKWNETYSAQFFRRKKKRKKSDPVQKKTVLVTAPYRHLPN